MFNGLPRRLGSEILSSWTLSTWTGPTHITTTTNNNHNNHDKQETVTGRSAPDVEAALA